MNNHGGRLLPGMTANVKLVVAEKPSVLKVPNAALRFRPAGDTAGAPTPGSRGPQAGGGTTGTSEASGQGGRPSLERIRERLVQGLKLTEQQQKKLDPILEDSRTQMRALAGVPEQERQAQAQKIREATRVRIRAILTPEQQAKYDQEAGARGRSATVPGRVWVVGADGNPVVVSLTVGLTDGSMTEVVQGDLKDGQEVIVGLAGRERRHRPASGTRRFHRSATTPVILTGGSHQGLSTGTAYGSRPARRVGRHRAR